MAEKDPALNVRGFEVTQEVETERFCDPCRFTGRNIQGYGYCETCAGHLCRDCLKAHKASKETREHLVISAAKYSATNSTDTIQKCEEHHSTIESYCGVHKKLCCHLCISNSHLGCKALIPIQRAASGMQGGSIIQNAATELDALLTQFIRLKTEEETEMKNITNQGEDFAKSVKDFRQEVNRVLDNVESALSKKQNEICKAEYQAVLERQKICENAIPVLSKARAGLDRSSKDTSEQNTFIIVKKVETVVRHFRPVLDKVGVKNGPFSLKFLPNEDLAKEVQSLGSLIVRGTDKLIIAEKETSKDDTNVTVTRKLKQSGEINVKADSEKTVCTITGCTFLPNKKLVIADETNRSLKVIDQETNVSLLHQLNVIPWDVVAVGKSRVAIRITCADSERDENLIKVLSVDDEIKQVADLKVDGRPRAVAYDEPNIYIAYTINKSSYIVVLDESYKIIHRIRPKPGVLKQPQYMIIQKALGKLYISDFYKGVIVLDFNGEKIAELKDKNKLTEFGGITRDAKDIYFCAGKPYGVYKLSKNCENVEELVTWCEGTIDPQAIIHNAENDSFVVTSCNSDKAFVFSYVDTV